MQFSHVLPTTIQFGKDVVRSCEWSAYGKRAFVVTGSHSGVQSGALPDVMRALRSHGIAFETFEGITNNPDAQQCHLLGRRAREFRAEVIIGVGGGSPLDAAKAIAVYAANSAMPMEEILTNQFSHAPLPVIAIPTTAGTGSEVTQYGVLTMHDLQTKRSFGTEQTFPVLALLDPAYTQTLPYTTTMHTAFDAFSHCFESWFSKRVTPLSELYAKEGMIRFSRVMYPVARGELAEAREELMLISMLGGLAISQNGTTHMHAMGYPLTYFYGVPHGLANAKVMPVYLDQLKIHEPDRLREALALMGLSFEELRAYAKQFFDCSIHPSEEELCFWASQAAKQVSVRNANLPAEEKELKELFMDVF